MARWHVGFRDSAKALVHPALAYLEILEAQTSIGAPCVAAA
ncbi:hypothetical protein X773_19245 [Mesorhizobium sp. LSJC285A00]|nr:hypothetical protein X773_19245 [Mesorhizobium sp. LSJC285A00]